MDAFAIAWLVAIAVWTLVAAAALREIARVQRCSDASSGTSDAMHPPLLSFVSIAPPNPGTLTGVRIPLEALGLGGEAEDDFRQGRVRTLLSADARTRVRVHVDADDLLILDRPFPWPAGHLIACVRDPDFSPVTM